MTRQRAEQGRGSIQKLGKNHYRVFVDFGVGANGKRQRPSRTVHGTRKDARAALSELQALKDGGIKAKGCKMTFSELAGEWLAEREADSSLAADTLRRSQYETRILIRYFGALKLESIDTMEASKGLRQIQADRAVGGTTMCCYRSRLKSIFEWAVRYRIVPYNPVTMTDVYKSVDKPNREGLSPFDALRLAREVEKSWAEELEKYRAKEQRQAERGNSEEREYVRGLSPLSLLVGIRLGLETGMRLGEVFGLTWACIDFGRGLILVREAVGRDGKLKRLKTESSRREIPVKKAMLDLLLEWKAIQAEMLAEIGIEQRGSSPVCCREIGGFMCSTDAGRRWRRWRGAHGFEGLKFHELRHTQATLLINSKKVPDITVSKRLGHKSTRMTAQYTHPSEEADYTAADVIGNLLGESSQEASEGGENPRRLAI